MRYVKTTDEPSFLRGAPKTIRTSDLFLRREAHYPAELWVREADRLPIILEGLVQGKDAGGFIDILFGGLYILATIYNLRR